MLVIQAFFVTGCTSALWDKKTFANHYRPDNPADLHLFYSTARKDILVQYNEWSDKDNKAQLRSYWLEPNILRVNRERKPHFTASMETKGLMVISVAETPPNRPASAVPELSAVARRDDTFFTLYSGNERGDPYKLPAYTGPSQRVKQVLLTPFAVIGDATIAGAIIGYFAAPSFLASLSR